MSLELTILGCHSATPRVNAYPTSQFLHIKNHFFLIDCGEGTQVQLRKYGVQFSKIKHIFISHLHGDHMFGLVGLISTFRLLNRENELHVYGPKGIKEIITLQLKLSNSWTHYPLLFHELSSDQSELIFEDESVEVHTIPLNHRIYTNGFLFKEKIGPRKLDMTAISEFKEIEICDYQNLKNGRDYTLKNGRIIKNKDLTTDPAAPKSYAFCSDTSYFPEIIPIIKNVSCLYHEATFLKDKEHLAESTKHSTAEQAAKIAKAADVKQLILGHFSGRYKNMEVFLDEAKPIFQNSLLAEEGKTFVIK
ncbi:ribonuclease Z [Lutibacter sp. HS1-25]|uniref:ribonuclease Z n=1 Tax=Lutibacter sp. HS1-25 TaxID=2485000 RepID=UPI00101194AC|nr:ribonuclease Z [Lutibacter sp. HS1-25]RXP53384.1 ribonuclease Z [Lutibacter sp. HS1-25]